MNPVFTEREVGGAVKSCPMEKRHWIEIAMVGEDARGIAYLEYEVVLPNGELVRGYLDQDGFARLERLADGGECTVRFPELDQEAWSLLEVKGARSFAELTS